MTQSGIRQIAIWGPVKICSNMAHLNCRLGTNLIMKFSAISWPIIWPKILSLSWDVSAQRRNILSREGQKQIWYYSSGILLHPIVRTQMNKKERRSLDKTRINISRWNNTRLLTYLLVLCHCNSCLGFIAPTGMAMHSRWIGYIQLGLYTIGWSAHLYTNRIYINNFIRAFHSKLDSHIYLSRFMSMFWVEKFA